MVVDIAFEAAQTPLQYPFIGVHLVVINVETHNRRQHPAIPGGVPC
jgi:hypothetical protein